MWCINVEMTKNTCHPSLVNHIYYDCNATSIYFQTLALSYGHTYQETGL